MRYKDLTKSREFLTWVIQNPGTAVCCCMNISLSCQGFKRYAATEFLLVTLTSNTVMHSIGLCDNERSLEESFITIRKLHIQLPKIVISLDIKGSLQK